MKNNSGMSMIEVLVSLAIIGFVALGTTAFYPALKSLQIKSKAQGIAKLGVFRIKDLIRNEAKWQLTLNHPSNDNELKCLRIKDDYDTNCPEFNRQVAGLNFYEKIGNTETLIYSSKNTNPVWGIDWNGDFCRGFELDVKKGGNFDCPFRLTTELSLHCFDTTVGCKIRNLEIVVKIKYNPGPGHMALNFSSLTFTENRIQHAVVLKKNCEEFGGNYRNNICELKTAAVICPGPNQAMVGIVNGVANCIDI